VLEAQLPRQVERSAGELSKQPRTAADGDGEAPDIDRTVVLAPSRVPGAPAGLVDCRGGPHLDPPPARSERMAKAAHRALRPTNHRLAVARDDDAQGVVMSAAISGLCNGGHDRSAWDGDRGDVLASARS